MTPFVDSARTSINAVFTIFGIFTHNLKAFMRLDIFFFAAGADVILPCEFSAIPFTMRFKTVISLVFEGKEELFLGICEGEILEIQKGKDGFGYDPIFMPKGYNKSFAEMDLKEKGTISHRGKAIQQLVHFLNNHF